MTTAPRARFAGDGRNVLDLESVGSRRFGEDDPGVRLHQRRDVRAHERVVISDLDAHARKHGVGEAACRMIDRIGDQHVIAGRKEGEERQGHRGEAGRHEHGAGRAFQLVERRRERVRRRRALGAVDIFLAARGHGRGIGEQHGRGVDDRRLDEAEEVARIVADMAQPRVNALVAVLVAVHEKVTAPSSSQPYPRGRGAATASLAAEHMTASNTTAQSVSSCRKQMWRHRFSNMRERGPFALDRGLIIAFDTFREWEVERAHRLRRQAPGQPGRTLPLPRGIIGKPSRKTGAHAPHNRKG